MCTVLVGNTGFVGSNLRMAKKFDYEFHSSDIQNAFGLNPEILVYAGIRAEMFLANENPLADLQLIREAAENIRKINPKKIVLISTAAVYEKPAGQDEISPISIGKLSAYGLNRYLLECWVQDSFSEHLIVRLPALYGDNLKKNFIYDLIHFIPKMLRDSKYKELSQSSLIIKKRYVPHGDGFYICPPLSHEEDLELRQEFQRLNFSALNFTDSRSQYQFYNLAYLWGHIEMALAHKIPKLNITTEPVTAAEVYHYVRGKDFVNHLSGTPFQYDLRSVYAEKLGGRNGYLFDKKAVLSNLKSFVEGAL